MKSSFGYYARFAACLAFSSHAGCGRNNFPHHARFESPRLFKTWVPNRKVAIKLAGIFLLMRCALTHAAWIEVSESSNYKLYVDFDTVHKVDDRVQVWIIYDNKTAKDLLPGTPYLSMKSQEEFDCKKQASRGTYSSFHAGNMGDGEVIFVNSEAGRWGPIPPQTPISTLWKVVCR